MDENIFKMNKMLQWDWLIFFVSIFIFVLVFYFSLDIFQIKGIEHRYILPNKSE